MPHCSLDQLHHIAFYGHVRALHQHPAGRTEFRAVKYYRPKVDELVKGVPEAIDRWRDTFGG